MKKYDLAVQVVKILRSRGFLAYFAGGAPRDFVMKNEICDIDIATDATPDEVESIFKKTIAVGKSFGVIIVVHKGISFEVATFRKDFEYKDGRHPTTVEFSSLEEDAKRRDFTINGLFFDPEKEKIIDLVGGREDIEKKVIRAIGDPELRIKEDRLRMIRAVRFATRFGFSIEKRTYDAILLYASTLFPHVAIERIWQEIEKMHKFNTLKESLLKLYELTLFQVIFPKFEGDIYKKVSSLKKFPKRAPSVAFICELFDKEQVDLCKYLKLSNKEVKLVEHILFSKEFLPKEHTLYEWAHFYSCDLSKLTIALFSSKREHSKRVKLLEPFIKRIKNHMPVVTSDHLKELGIEPGKSMGILLKEAEKIAINDLIEHPAPIIEKLREKFSDHFD